jgi:hypothetical protein
VSASDDESQSRATFEELLNSLRDVTDRFAGLSGIASPEDVAGGLWGWWPTCTKQLWSGVSSELGFRVTSQIAGPVYMSVTIESGVPEEGFRYGPTAS